MFILNFKRIFPEAKAPVREYPDDAGADVFWCDSKEKDPGLNLQPGEGHIFPTGLIFEIPTGYMIQVCNKGGIAAKKNLIYGAHIVDAGFGGELFINLHNIGNKPILMEYGQKLAQIVLSPIVSCRFQEKSDLYIDPIVVSNARGGNCLGSTGTK